MKKQLLALFLALPFTAAFANNSADVNLFTYIQYGTISNDNSSTANIVKVVYDLGTAADGIATWDRNPNPALSGGVASNFLSNNRHFQTLTWSGLSVAPGDNFNFRGLDIDLIQTLSPLSVTGTTLDSNGSSLVNASVSIFWDNGTSGSASLAQQAWSQTQNLTITSAVPEPSTIALMLGGLGLVGFMAARRQA